MIYKSLVKKVSIPVEKKTKQKEYLESGRLPIVDQGKELIGGYTDDVNNALDCNLPVIVFGDHTKAVKYINFPFGAGADGIKVLEPKEEILPKYLYYGTHYLTFKIVDKGYARHYQHIEKKDLPVPPLEEQHRIVTRIEELFSQLDSGVETLKKTKEQLKVYRQAILSEAFPTLSKANKKLLYEIAEISGGITKGRKLSPNDSIELPYLRVANVQNGYLNLSQIKTIQLKRTEREKYLLKFGDVLYTEGGDRDKLGRGTVWKDEVANCVHQNHIFKARINNSLAIPEYIAYWSMAGTAREYFYKNGKQTVNLASINKTVLSNLPIPIVPLELQYKTIKEIESRLSVCDSIEKTIDTALQEAEALRQSILKQAFEGGL